MRRIHQQATLGEQIETLRKMGLPWVGPMATALFVVPALILLYRAFAFQEYPLIIFVFFFGLFAGIVSRGMRPIRQAIAGIETDDKKKGRARIRTEEWSDSIDYMLDVTVSERGTWSFQFRPQHWVPEAGEFEVECRFIPEVAWPVLVLSDRGIMFPSRRPRLSGGVDD